MIMQTTPRNQYCFSFLIIIIGWFFLCYDKSVFIISLIILYKTFVLVVVQSLCPILVTPWTTTRQASLSFPIFQSLLRLFRWPSGCKDSLEKEMALHSNILFKGSIPGSGRSPGRGNGNPLQYSYLNNSMDRGAWQTIVRGLTKSWTRLSN